MVLGRVEGPSRQEGTSAHFWHTELKRSVIMDFMVWHNVEAANLMKLVIYVVWSGQWLEGQSFAAKQGIAPSSEGNDPTVLFLLLLQQTREVCQLFQRMKQLCGFDITDRAQMELQRKGAAFELVRTNF